MKLHLIIWAAIIAGFIDILLLAGLTTHTDIGTAVSATNTTVAGQSAQIKYEERR